MRLTTVILIATLMQVSAATFGQRITINQRKASFEQVLKSIRNQSGYDVIMDRNILKKAGQVNISVKDATIDEAMKSLLSGLPLKYTIDGKIIVIEEKSGTIIDNIIARFQAIDVRGKVVDSLGNGLAGATVSVKSGKGSTSTDAGGNFMLKNVDEGAVLVVSYLGYVTREVSVSKEFNYVQLQQSSSKLDEVQIQAYGVTSRRLSTGNISTVKAEDIEKQPVNNPLLALQGRVPGLEIVPLTGLAGGPVNLQIRGRNSLNFETSPLIVVDGMPIVNNIPGLGHPGFTGNLLSSLSFLSPSSIMSIEVLKDADATSIYGSRGANGVILITTKKGKIGETKLEVNAHSGWSNVPSRVKMLNTDQYLNLRKEAYANSGINIETLPYNSSRPLSDLKFWNQNRYTDWQEELIGSAARYTNFQATLAGGTSKTQYIIGGNFNRENTVFEDDNFNQKGGIHFSITGTTDNQKLKTTISGAYISNKNTLPGIDLTALSLSLAPNAPSLKTEDGELNWEKMPSGARSWDNPYAELAKKYEATIDNIIATADLSYEPFSSLEFKTTLGYNRTRGNSIRRYRVISASPPETKGATAAAAFNENNIINMNAEPQVSYKANIGEGKLNLLIGGSFQTTSAATELIDVGGFTHDALVENLELGLSPRVKNTSSQYKYSAMFGRINYNFDNKYLLNIAARRDGSSRFGPGQQFGNFASVGVAWIISEEKIFKSMPSFFSFGKIRASYGSSGNDGIGDYQYLERYSSVNATDPYLGVKGYQTTGIFNSNYHWETTRKFELGIETGFFEDRIFTSASFFKNRSDNQLIGQPLPSTVGPGIAFTNFPATVQIAGFESVVTTENIKSNLFNWTSAINFSTVKNKLVSFDNFEQSNYTTYLELGKPFYGQASVYESAGVDPLTGRLRFKDRFGNNTFEPDTTTKSIRTDAQFYGGFLNSFTYKGFSLNILFQFSKQVARNPLLNYFGSAGGGPLNVMEDFADRWQKPGDVSNIPKVNYLKSEEDWASFSLLEASDFAYVDASYIKLKNISFSYSFSERVSKKIKARNLKIYMQGQNLWTLTKYKGFDPETKSISSLPLLRTIVVGLQITF